MLAGSSQSKITASVALGVADHYYDLGTITFTSGLNNGLTATIKTQTASDCFLNIPLPFAVAAGDTYNLFPGCDKQQATCSSAKFNNLQNFGGFPYTPVAETAI